MGNEWYLRTQDEVFGPESKDRLIEWARLGRIQPGQDISDDGENWVPATEIPFLDMRWSIDIGDGNPRGPFNRQAAQALLASGRLPRGSKLVEVREPFGASTPAPVVEERSAPETPAPSVSAPQPAASAEVEELKRQIETLHAGLRAAEKRAADAEARAAEARKEARIAIKAADVAEARMAAVQAEKDAAVAAVQTEKDAAVAAAQADKAAAVAAVQADKDAAVAAVRKDVQNLQQINAQKADELADAQKALEELEERKKGELAAKEGELAAKQGELAAKEGELAAAKAEVSAAKASEAKYEDRIQLLSDELKRLPPTAQLAADAQAAVYTLMKEEAEELAASLESETREIDELRRFHQARRERLLVRRQEILRRIGTDAEDMTRRALKTHPEDPRTVHMRQELEALRLLQEKSALESERKIRDLATKLRERDTEAKRLRQQAADVTVIYRQLQEARERLQLREKELVEERQKAEADRQREAAAQQALLARLSALEMGLPGTTNQSREARSVRLAPWMGLKK